MRTLHIDDFLQPNEAFHIVRNNLAPENTSNVVLHTHDFVEVFWIEKGEGSQHIQSQGQGQQFELPLKQGDLHFIRAKDIHHLSCSPNQDLQLINIALREQDLFQFVQQVLPPEATEPAYWNSPSDHPPSLSLTTQQQDLLFHMSQKLLNAPRSRLMLQWFLCELYRCISSHSQIKTASDAPLWLSEGLQQLHLPEHFRQGSQVLSKLCHRSTEHVARAVRKHYHTTPSALVNQARIQHATRALIQSQDEIVDIALDCGFQSLGQFYRLFKEQHNTSPKKYRMHHRRIQG